jgi:hypothetical protein
MADAPPDFKAVPLGEASEVRQRISTVLPQVDWTDPAWGTLDGEGFSIEFNTKAEGTIDGLMLHVRGNGDPLPAIGSLCRQNGWAALDMTTGDFLDAANPSRAGWDDFREFRDQIKSYIVARYYRRIALYVAAVLAVAGGITARMLISHRLLGGAALVLGIALALLLFQAARRSPRDRLTSEGRDVSR